MSVVATDCQLGEVLDVSSQPLALMPDAAKLAGIITYIKNAGVNKQDLENRQQPHNAVLWVFDEPKLIMLSAVLNDLRKNNKQHLPCQRASDQHVINWGRLEDVHPNEEAGARHVAPALWTPSRTAVPSSQPSPPDALSTPMLAADLQKCSSPWSTPWLQWSVG